MIRENSSKFIILSFKLRTIYNLITSWTTLSMGMYISNAQLSLKVYIQLTEIIWQHQSNNHLPANDYSANVVTATAVAPTVTATAMATATVITVRPADR